MWSVWIVVLANNKKPLREPGNNYQLIYLRGGYGLFFYDVRTQRVFVNRASDYVSIRLSREI